jgi:hypothetical protein
MMTAPTAELVQPAPAGAAVQSRTAAPESLPTFRLNIMRGGYLLMAAGLALTKWPLFVQGTAASLPAFEGVVAALLGAMSLLAILGLRYPVQMLPLLIFESAWKLIWLAAVAVPQLINGGMSSQMSSILSSVSLVVVIIAVTPWDYVWKRYVVGAGDPWRAPPRGGAA